jgi:hypothetical protein
MCFGKWRVTPLAWTLAAVLGMGLTTTAFGDGWRLHPTLPGEVPAYDYTTGGEYFAPPIPYGHYAKDPHAEAAKALGHFTGPIRGLCSRCLGLFHHGDDGNGNGCGLGGKGCGHGLGGNGDGCGNGCGHGLGGNGCGFCSGLGLFHHGKGDPCGGCGSTVCGGGCGLLGHGKGGHGLGHKKNFAPCHASTVVATAQSQPSSQVVLAPSGQSACGDPGCGIGGVHSHLGNLKNKIRCRLCGGMGGPCGGCGGLGIGDPCGVCGGAGLLGGLGHGKACGACGGCGLFRHGGTGCGLCGGKGCAACLKGAAAKAHGILGHIAGTAMGLLGHGKVDWFVGAGGPVPLTPGYVPYIVSTRSPRDYFAFPPMNPNDP